MSKVQFNHKDLVRFEIAVSEAKQIAIFPHTAPDGDALGSTLAMARILQLYHPNTLIHVICPDKIERYLQWIPLQDSIISYQTQENKALEYIQGADLLIHMDHNTISRLRYTPLIDAVEKNTSTRILIDHHLYPDESINIRFSYPEVSSTCELCYYLLESLGWEDSLESEVATSLLIGIITDTGRFAYSNLSSELFEIVSKLLRLGGDYNRIIDQLIYHNQYKQLQLQGYIMYEKFEFYPEYQAVLFSLSQEEMKRFGATKGDTEGLVNLPLSIDGVINSCFIREDETQIKLSLRSTGDFPINKVAMEGFGGGGHLNASGAEFKGSLEEAKNTYLCVLERIYKQYKQEQYSNH